jgi:hypothetical protein
MDRHSVRKGWICLGSPQLLELQNYSMPASVRPPARLWVGIQQRSSEYYVVQGRLYYGHITQPFSSIVSFISFHESSSLHGFTALSLLS